MDRELDQRRRPPIIFPLPGYSAVKGSDYKSPLTTAGDMLYRELTADARLAGVYGAGVNFLHMNKVGSQLIPEWLDITSIIQIIGGGNGGFIHAPTLVIKTPSISEATVYADSGSDQTQSTSRAVATPSISVATANTDSGSDQTQVVTLTIGKPTISAAAVIV